MNSKTVFELRNEAKNLQGIAKLNKLTEALNLAQRLYYAESYDGWIQKAFAYTLIDLSKYYISLKNTNQAGIYYDQLLSINFQEHDDIIESQKSFLRPKIDINFSEVQKAEDLSKSGNHQEAINIFKILIVEHRLTELHHEAYGWTIYRLIKDKENELTSIQVRTFLKDYMNLRNERPSMLHSMILNFGLHYSKGHSDFNLYNFFKLWNPSNLRTEDKEKQHFNGKEIPSLISRVVREFNDKDLLIDIDYLIDYINLNSRSSSTSSAQQILDLLREPIFWKLFNAYKENKQSELWNIFSKYNQQFSKYEKSKWHSEILSIAERYMQETEEWRFLEFFRIWNPEKLRDEDWIENKKDDKVFKPLAIKCIKKAFKIIKNQNKVFNEGWLIPIYSQAVKFFPDDEWLLRENALLLIKNNEIEAAANIYRRLVLELGDKSYIWSEFSSCFKNGIDLKIGMLSKAIQLEKDEDFLGDIHLELAEALLEIGLNENCVVELDTYRRHRESKGWQLSESYNEILEKTKSNNTNLLDNKILYEKYVPIAEQHAYEEIDWTEAILVDRWKNAKGLERIAFTNGKNIEFSVSSRRFKRLRQSNLGKVFKFKLHKQEVKDAVETKISWPPKKYIPEYKYIPLIVEKSDKADWSILDDIYATIDYINVEKNIVHAICCDNREVFFPMIDIELEAGDFIEAKCFTRKVKDEIKLELKEIQKTDKEIAIAHFQKKIVVIDGINLEKKLFHYVGSATVQGIIKFTETDIVPKEGKFLEIYIVSKRDKKNNKNVFKAVQIQDTQEVNPKLVKSINGNLKLKYKRDGRTIDYFDLENDETSKILPDFGFIGDFYVPRNVLRSKRITSNCDITATAIFSGDKWKIIELDEV